MGSFFSKPMSNRQMTRLALLGIILVTLPCYCLGAVLLAYAPSKEKPTPIATLPTLGGSVVQPSMTASLTPFLTNTPPGGPLQPTPPQLWLPTNTPFVYATWTPYVYPTIQPPLTIAPSLTLAPSATLAPSNTPAPTSTPQPTNTPVPTDTPLPTDTPQPTFTEVPTEVPTVEVIVTQEPSPTQEVISP